MKGLKPEVYKILEIIRDYDPSDLKKELEVRDAQRPILLSALRRAILRKEYSLPKRNYIKPDPASKKNIYKPDSPYITIDFLSDIVVELYYGKKIKKSSLEIEIINFMNKVLAEITKIYNVLKIIGFSGGKTNTQDDYRNAALNYFDENYKKFKYLKREYIEDFNLYSFVGGQETRFKSKLFQKMVSDSGFGEYAERDLLKLIRKTDQKR